MSPADASNRSIRVLVVYLREWHTRAYGMNEILRLSSPFDVYREPVGLEDPATLELIRTQRPEVVLLTPATGRSLPASEIGAALTAIEETSDATGVVLLTERGGSLATLPTPTRPRAYVASVDLGGKEVMVTAIRAVAEGSAYLSPSFLAPSVAQDGNPLRALTQQQHEVLRLMADGLSNAAIADRMVLSAKAVENHITGVFRALDLKDEDTINRRVTAVLIFNRYTWL